MTWFASLALFIYFAGIIYILLNGEKRKKSVSGKR